MSLVRLAGRVLLLFALSVAVTLPAEAGAVMCKSKAKCYKKGKKAFRAGRHEEAAEYFRLGAAVESGGGGSGIDLTGDGISDEAYVPELMGVHAWVRAGRPCEGEYRALWQYHLGNRVASTVVLPLRIKLADAERSGLECEDPAQPDQDGDGIFDASDNCRDLRNPAQEDTDGNTQGDACQTPTITAVKLRANGALARDLGGGRWDVGDLPAGVPIVDFQSSLALTVTPASACSSADGRRWACRLAVQGEKAGLSLTLATRWDRKSTVSISGRLPRETPETSEWNAMRTHADMVKSRKGG